MSDKNTRINDIFPFQNILSVEFNSLYNGFLFFFILGKNPCTVAVQSRLPTRKVLKEN